MRKILLTVPFFLLLASAPALAAPVPPLKETAPYKNLRSYVGFLGGVQEATSAEKNTYSATFTARLQRAEAQVLSLRERRELRTARNYKTLLQKRYREVNQRAGQRSRKARRDARRKKKEALGVFQRTRRSIEASYERQLRPLRTRVRQLRRRQSQSRDPRERALLAEEINLLRRKIIRIENVSDADVSQARGEYKQSERQINKRLGRSLRAIARQRGVERQETKSAWAAERKSAFAAIAEKRRKEAALVRELRVRGQENLDAILVVGG